MKDKTEENRHKNLLKFVHSALLAYTIFAVLLILGKFTLIKNLHFAHIFIYIGLYSSAITIFYFFIKKKYYLKLNSDKNFFIIPSIVGVLLGQYYFFILGNARWIYVLVLSISYLGVTYQSYKVVLSLSLSSATINLLIVISVHIFKIQEANIVQDLLVVASHYIITAFMIPITRFFNEITNNYRAILHVLRDRNHIIEKDLELAYTIQKSLLPSEYPKYKNMAFASTYIPMDVIGGDFYDFIKISDNEIGIFISDVSGHGVPAALITSMIKVAVSSVDRKQLKNPSSFFEEINSTLLDKTAMNFITAFYGIYNSEKKTFRYSNAGHCAPIFIDNKNSDFIQLEAHGIVLGAFDNVDFEEKEIKLNTGDKLIFYTDGLIETMDANRELYAMEGLKKFSKKNRKLPINAFIHCLFEDVCGYMATDNFEDDIVIIGIDIL